MSLAILIDMNLSIEWVPVLEQAGWPAVHWSQVGRPDAEDALLMQWATAHHHVVFTHDLDFGTTLALTQASGPSVLQVRGQNVMPQQMASTVLTALRQYEAELAAGAIVVVDKSKSRARVLPL